MPADPTNAPIPLIVGPTAGGKSALAMELVRALAERDQPAELVSADAYQIYRGMDIGTAKPTADERAAVPHHLIDIREPDDPVRYTVHDWRRDAIAVIDDIRARRSQPIVVGGTHLYAKALLDGLFEGPEPDPALRETLSNTPLDALRAELARIDPPAFARIHPNDRRRTVRAVEVFRQTGVPISQHQSQWDRSETDPDRPEHRFLTVILDWAPEDINPRINARVRHMLDAGLAAEVRALWLDDRLGSQAIEALGYKQLVDHYQRRCSMTEAVEQIKILTRRFAKAQRTWLKRLRAGDPSRPALRLQPALQGTDRMAESVMEALVAQTKSIQE